MRHTTNTIQSIVLILLFLGPVLYASPAPAVMAEYCSTPPFITNTVTPNILIIMDNSGSMNEQAYPTAFNPAQFSAGHYYGYFDPLKKYKYSTSVTPNRWVPTSEPMTNGTSTNPIANGDYLNWVTTRRVDVSKKLLIGGKASAPGAAYSAADRTTNPVKLYGEDSTGFSDTFQKDYDTTSKPCTAGDESDCLIYPFIGNFRYTVSGDELEVDRRSGGSTATVTIYPNSTQRAGNWTPSGATSNHLAVDEVTADEDSTYIMNDTTNSDDRVEFGYSYTEPSLIDPALDSYTIANIAVHVRARKTGDNTRRIVAMLQVDGDDDFSAYNSVSQSYDDYTFTWDENPETNASWTWADIRGTSTNPLQRFGVDAYSDPSSSNHFRVTQVYLVVTYYTGPVTGGPYKNIVDQGSTRAQGILDSMADDVRFGLAFYNTDAQGATIASYTVSGTTYRTYVDFNSVPGMIQAVSNVNPSTNTPLAESLYNMTRYFRQEDPYFHTSDYTAGLTNDPFYYQYSKLSGGLADRYVPCAKSFIIFLTDGEPTSDSGNPTTPGSNFADVALWMRTQNSQDVRNGTCTTVPTTFSPPCIPGRQSVYLYPVFLFGRGSTLLKQAAINGGFDDLDGDHQPDCATNPRECYRDSNNDGVVNSTDMPITYYEGDDGYELETSLINAISNIMRRAASGTAVSVLTTSSRGAGSMIQAYFLPVRQEGLREVRWVGYSQNIWLDSVANLREDNPVTGTAGDKKLKLAEDRVIKLFFDSSSNETKAAFFTTDILGQSDPLTPGTLASCQKSTSKAFSDVVPLWEAGTKLALRDPSDRSIFTAKKVIRGATETVLDASTTAKEPAFTTSLAASPFKDALNADATYTADNIIRYIRGECLETGSTSCGSTANATYRDRRVTVSGGNANGNVWKLGDIISSTPKTFGNSALNVYHMNYLDNSYADYVGTAQYKNRSTIAFFGANDGMLHAMRVGYMKSKGFDLADVAAGVKAIFQNFWNDDTNDQLGKEVWAYIPYNVFPYLKYLADPTYCHIYYNDMTVTLLDVSLGGATNPNPGDIKTVDSWKTVLVGGMRFGGACSGADANPATPPAGASATVGFSSYYALDITDPENPVPLWEFNDPDMGYSVSQPGVIRTSPGTKDGVWYKSRNGHWYVVIGSGSKIMPKSGTDIGRTTTGYTYILDLKTGALVKKIALDHNAIVGDILPADTDNDYYSERVYFGTSYKDVTTWKGKLVKIDIPNQDLSQTWTPTVTTLFAGNYPITASPEVAWDTRQTLWAYAGTGKYYSDIDQITTAQQIVFGVQDRSTITYPLTTADLSNRTTSWTEGMVAETQQVCWFDSAANDFHYATAVTRINRTSTLPAYPANGWYNTFTTSPTAERVISKPVAIGGLLDVLSYQPSNDPCSGGGNTNLYTLDLELGIVPPQMTAPDPKATTIIAGGTGGGTVGSYGGSVNDKVRLNAVSLGPGAPPQGDAIIIPPPPDEEGKEKLKKLIQVSTGAIITAENDPLYNVTSRVLHWLKK